MCCMKLLYQYRSLKSNVNTEKCLLHFRILTHGESEIFVFELRAFVIRQFATFLARFMSHDCFNVVLPVRHAHCLIM